MTLMVHLFVFSFCGSCRHLIHPILLKAEIKICPTFVNQAKSRPVAFFGLNGVIVIYRSNHIHIKRTAVILGGPSITNFPLGDINSLYRTRAKNLRFKESLIPRKIFFGVASRSRLCITESRTRFGSLVHLTHYFVVIRDRVLPSAQSDDVMCSHIEGGSPSRIYKRENNGVDIESVIADNRSFSRKPLREHSYPSSLVQLRSFDTRLQGKFRNFVSLGTCFQNSSDRLFVLSVAIFDGSLSRFLRRIRGAGHPVE